MTKFVTLREAEKFAKKKIDNKIFNWLQSGAEDNCTYKKNFEDLSKIRIKPKHLNAVKNINTECNFFGKIIQSPLILSPMGHQTQFHKDGEIKTFMGVSSANSISFFSTQGRISLDDIREKNKKGKLGWTIFPFGDKNWIKKEIRSAEKNKCLAVVVCIDANVRSWRYQDREARYDARSVGRRTNPIPQNPSLAVNYNWDLISFIKKKTKLPVIVKGILTLEDAKEAIRCKADGIWISNHGGRMFNSGISGVEALIEIKDNLKKNSKTKIIVDGGVRKGSDVIKYLCLGADFVAIGRPAIHGLICDSNKGVEKIFNILNNEIKTSMINGGFKNKLSFKKERLKLNE
jgi:isopentenyl diphosphate isomerase/L-lactate dehydrogenase-like FMN-dependent dehydrogenase